jgi:hypothetical protein
VPAGDAASPPPLVKVSGPLGSAEVGSNGRKLSQALNAQPHDVLFVATSVQWHALNIHL